MKYPQDTPAATIMTVDDTVENLELLEDMLTSGGYRVVQFPRGELAIRAALRNPPDLILLDVMMPYMNGYQVCRTLKQNESLSDIPVIFVSALGDAESKVKAFIEGGVDYVTKPYQDEEVLARIRIHLELRDARRKLQDQAVHLEEIVRERTYDLNQAQKVANIGSWKLTLADGLIVLSEQACTILGFGVKSAPYNAPITLEKWMEKIHPDDRQKVWDIWLEAKGNTTDGYAIEYRILKENNTIWVHEDAEFEMDDNGRPLRAIGTVQDVTERRTHLEALEKQNQALRDIAWTQSHMVRAPLVRMMGLLDVLDDEHFAGMERAEILREINRSTKELDGIIRNISKKTDQFFNPDETESAE